MEVKNVVRRVWGDILNKNSIGDDDDFFDLGGDSLALMEMLFQVGRELDRDIDIDLIYQNSTLGGFSELVAGAA